MKVITKSYNLRFYPNKIQRDMLEHEFGCSRFVWNHFLELHSQSNWINHQELKSSGCLPDELNLFDHFNPWNYNQASFELTQLKKLPKFAWLNNVNSSTLSQKLMDLNKAFKSYFTNHAKLKAKSNKKNKKGKVSTGYPQFKKKSHEQSIRLQLDQRHIHKNYTAGHKLNIPKLGELNLIWSITPKGIPKQLTIRKKCNGHYYVSFMCEETILPFVKTGKSVGLDVGIKSAVVSSDNEDFGPSQFLKLRLRDLKREQRILSRKTKGSNRWSKQRLVVARIHNKVANARQDLLHKITTYLVKTYDILCIEDLAVQNMLKNHKLARSLSDVGLGEFFRLLNYKANWYGKTVVKVGRYYPSSKTCSHCKHVKKHLSLNERIYECTECGLKIDRDLNAAINIENEGCRILEEALLASIHIKQTKTTLSV